MAHKVVDIRNNMVTIGMDNGGIREFDTSCCNFVPHIGDIVEIFESDSRVIVSKVQGAPNQGFQFNITQNAQEAPQGKRLVNKVAYALLAFFLGGLGIHHFYAGKTAAGVLSLLFCWTTIPGIIALVNFIQALCATADANGNIYM